MSHLFECTIEKVRGGTHTMARELGSEDNAQELVETQVTRLGSKQRLLQADHLTALPLRLQFSMQPIY